MASGIFGASLINMTNGTTANAPDVDANDLALKANGINNDGGLITTDGAGGMTLVSVSNAQGIIRGVFFLATPYLLLNAVTINSAVVNTYTVTGGATGVPTGATGILFSIYGTGASAGGWLSLKPHGATVANNSNYPMVGLVQVAGATPAAFGMVAVSGGQIDVSANSSNFTGINMSIYGYIF